MVLLLVICIALPVLALATQRNDFKRVGLIAVGLEAAKYLFFFSVSRIEGNEFFGLVFTFVFYVTMLPEMMIGSESESSTVWQWILRLLAGIVWNLAPAYLISLFLPDRPANKSG